MSLIKCYECKKDVSTEAATCPHCGAKSKKDKQADIGAVILLIIIIAAITIYAFFGGDSEESLDNTEVVNSKQQQQIDLALDQISKEEWPFTANKVSFGCYSRNAVMRIEEGENAGKFYALNGTAMKYLPGAREVTIDNIPASSSHFIGPANKLCDDEETYWYSATYTPETGDINMVINKEIIKTPRQAGIEKIESQLSAWNGEHRNLAKLIKSNLHDPNSYEHVDTKLFAQKDHWIIITTYRAKNGFGGNVLTTTKAKVSFDGVVLEIIE